MLVQPMIDMQVDKTEFLALVAVLFWSRGKSTLRSDTLSDAEGLFPQTEKTSAKVQNKILKELIEYLREKKIEEPGRRVSEILLHLTRINVSTELPEVTADFSVSSIECVTCSNFKIFAASFGPTRPCTK